MQSKGSGQHQTIDVGGSFSDGRSFKMIKEAQIQNLRTLQKKQDLDNQQVTKNGSASFRMKAHKM